MKCHEERSLASTLECIFTCFHDINAMGNEIERREFPKKYSNRLILFSFTLYETKDIK